MDIITSLFIGTLIIIINIIIHANGLSFITTKKQSIIKQHHYSSTKHSTLIVISIILGILFLHTVEVWIWAISYMFMGLFNDLETALYFSTTTFTTLGYGDIVLDKYWRLISVLQSANGLLLFGWSTAYIFYALSNITHKK